MVDKTEEEGQAEASLYTPEAVKKKVVSIRNQLLLVPLKSE